AVNQTSCIINMNKSCKVKTNNIKETKIEAVQELDPIPQNAQVPKKDT
ncbi:27775_t:CDS:1, partial [Gigaspora margarita]